MRKRSREDTGGLDKVSAEDVSQGQNADKSKVVVPGSLPKGAMAVPEIHHREFLGRRENMPQCDLRSGIESAFERITEELAKQRQQQVQQRKVISDRITVEEIDRLLPDPDFQKRQSEVSESHDGTYDLFAKDVQEYP
jgi:hypothetical protein